MKNLIDAEPALEVERYEFFEEPRYRFEPDRREFMQMVGGGIVVALVLTDVLAAQQQGRGRGGQAGATPGDLSAWIHIDEAGKVTAFTGKVEVGQNARTSVTQAVAEELHLPVGSIQVVMGDTDRVPFDGGTFGSGTSPRMIPTIRRAAAGVRDLLIELAAERDKLNKSELSVADGKVVHAPTNKAYAFGDLTKGQKLTRVIRTESKLAAAGDWKVLGTSVPKVNARDIVTGKHKYSSDMKLPGMLYGKVLRADTVKGSISSLDTKAAEAMSGIVVVRDKNFVGVAAPTEQQAEQALAAIKAEWNPGAKISDKDLWADLKKGGGQGGRGGGGGRGGNPGRGSVDEGLKAADHKVQATYTIAYIAHTPLEPRAAVAQWQEGKLTVWTGTQGPFRVKSELATAFGLAQDKVRVIMPDTGSGYGGKHSGECAVEAARLAKAAGKPVKLVWTREEEFTWAYYRPAGVIDVNAGVTKDGIITAWDFHNYNSGGSAISPLYNIANQRSQFHGAQSPLKQGSYRALAATANHFARECHIDELANAVGMDPLEFRLKNLKDPRFRSVLEAAAAKFGWGKSKPEAGHGFGIAGGEEKNSYVATCAEIAHDKTSGQVRVVRAVTAFECGAVLNPDNLKNQIEGAVVQGLGGALFEAVRFDDGKILNASMRDYRLPRFSDLPVLETVLLDRKDQPSAGAGETPIVAIAPAISNAILQATGIRRRSMPMVPEGLKV
jgi:CO/xanthine dehydrogenase Mo-binding subunit